MGSRWFCQLSLWSNTVKSLQAIDEKELKAGGQFKRALRAGESGADLTPTLPLSSIHSGPLCCLSGASGQRMVSD